MNGFLILFFIGATTADQLGYNYQQGGQNLAFEGIGTIDNDIGNQGINAIDIRTSAIGNSYGVTNAFSSGFGGFDSVNSANGYSTNDKNGFGVDSGSGINSNTINAIPVSFEYNKEIFSYTAPDEDINDHDSSQQNLNSLKKNLRIIFIKAPENQALTNAALQFAQQSSKDRTAIYVLTKQTDVGELTNKLQTIKNGNSYKPEVHFVKYRTPEDAVYAQQVIQAQYDTLGGQSHISNEEVAPVFNFASPNTANREFVSSSGGYSGINTSSSSSAENAGYLPPVLRRAYVQF